MLLWIILADVAAAVVYAIVVFNGLVRTRQMANEAWSGIDAQLSRAAARSNRVISPGFCTRLSPR
jgi:LemA protein